MPFREWPQRRRVMRLVVVVALGVLVTVLPVLADASALSFAAELGAGVITAGLSSYLVAGISSQVREFSAALQGVDLSEVSVPAVTRLVAGGVALLAAPFMTVAVVTAVGESFGVTSRSAHAVSVIFAYVSAALVFDREWRQEFTPPEWLPTWLPEWIATFTVATSLSATIGFNLGVVFDRTRP